MARKTLNFLLVFVLITTAPLAQSRQAKTATFDTIIRGGTVYDGSGRAPRRADVGIRSRSNRRYWQSQSRDRHNDN